jgi:hypothetical protein
MERLQDYVSGNGDLLVGVSLASLLLFVGSLALVPWLVKRAPHDVFVRARPVRNLRTQLFYTVVKNVVGLALAVAGVAMLVLPGQGLLTLLVAFALLDLPGKQVLLRRLVRRPAVWRALCYLRKRSGAPPFEPPP